MNLLRSGLTAGAVLAASSLASATVLYSDDFNVNSSANYNVSITNGAGGLPSSDVTFAYDYSAMGIPSAPSNAPGDTSTSGVRIRIDNLRDSVGPAAVGAVSVSLATVGYSLTTPYTLQADIWGNYQNPSAGAANTTTGVGIGIAGTGAQTPNAFGGAFVGAIHDGASSQDYRVYAGSGGRRLGTSGDYAAGTGSDTLIPNNTNVYYANSTVLAGGKSAPAAQKDAGTFGANVNTNTTTPNGIIGFAWHTFYLQNDGTNVTWYIDSLKISTTPVSLLTGTGSNISFGGFDTGLTGSTVAPFATFNFDIVDNVVLQTGLVPEPTSLGVLGIAALGIVGRRRRGH